MSAHTAESMSALKTTLSMFTHSSCRMPVTLSLAPQHQLKGSVYAKATSGVQSNLEKEVERERALAEAEGRIKENRENEDVNRRAMQLRLQEERNKLVAAINTTFSNVGAGTVALLTDKERLTTAVLGLSVLALGVYTAREGTKVAGQVFSR